MSPRAVGRVVGSSLLLGLLSLAALLFGLVHPSTPAAILALVLALHAAAAVGLEARRDRRRRSLVRAAFVAALLATGAIALGRARLTAIDDDGWARHARARLEAGADLAQAAIVGLQSAAIERARAALVAVDETALEPAATPLPLCGTPLPVGVSVWRDGLLLRWAGEVPGPDRPPFSERPLIVDRGFRRTLTVAVRDTAGATAFVDVGLGITRELFPRLGMGEDPGHPISRATGLRVEVLAQPAVPEAVEGALDLLLAVPEGDPWVWLTLSAAGAREERRWALQRRASGVAWGLLACLATVALAAWDAWPRWRSEVPSRWRVPLAALVIGALRVGVDRAGVLSAALGGAQPPWRYLLEPAYFATTWGGGLLRSVLDFLLTSACLALVAAVALRGWLGWTGAARTRVLRAAALVALSVLAGAWGAALHRVVAQNANPKLVGLDAPFFTLPFLALHVALLLALAALALPAALGWERLLRGARSRAAWAATGATLAALAGIAAGLPVPAWVAAGLLPLVGLLLSPLATQQSLAMHVLGGLLLVTWTAGFQAEGLRTVYTRMKELVALERAEERLRPADNWRRFLLEDLLGEIAQDSSALQRLTDPGLDRSNAAFELWAGSSLSALGYGSRVELLDRGGGLLSDFDLNLPYEPAPANPWELRQPDPEQPWSVEALEMATEEGPFLVYQGRLWLGSLVPEGDASWLVVELPYAAVDPAAPVDLAATGPAALGFAAGRELAPRREFEEPIVFGRLDQHGVVAATDPALLGLPRSQLPGDGSWKVVTLARVPRRARLVEGAGGTDLAVAFAEPRMAERLLDVSRLIALHLAAGAAVAALLLLLHLLRALPAARWPAALGDWGVQERLLATLVLVVLLPVIVSGAFHEQQLGARLRRENLEEVARRLDTALRLLASSLDETAASLIDGEYMQDVLRTGTTSAQRDIGTFERTQAMAFGVDGTLLLDETLRDLDPARAAAFLQSVQSGELMLETDASGWTLGRLYATACEGDLPCHVFVRRRLADEDLGRLARTVGADLTLYDGPWAVVSSQDDLYKAGLLSPVLPARASLAVLQGGSRRHVQAQPQEGLVVATGFAPLAGPDAPRRGVLAARLFSRATESALEQRRADLFLLGISSLAFVLAVVVGLWASARIVRPLRLLATATRRIGRGELDLRLPGGGRDEIGQLIGSFNRMTGDLQQTQRSLAARRGFLEAMLGNLSAGVLVLDGAGEVREINTAGRALLPEGEGELLSRVRELRPEQGVTSSEIVVRAAGGPRTLRLVVTPIQLESGEPGWLALFDDVTELLATRQLALYAEMARQVAHEVKNPLTPIQLAAQMVRQAVGDRHPRMDSIVDENVRQIEAQVERLRWIAAEFSLLGRAQLPPAELVPVARLLASVSALYPSHDGSLRVEWAAPDGLLALASREALLKVLTNLVQNGLQAMGGRGRIALRARREGARVVLEVEDEGPGIPAEVQDRLFEPYFSTKSTGTGLGLVVCRNLMEKMGGSIRLQNRPDGRGAEAVLELPAADGAPPTLGA